MKLGNIEIILIELIICLILWMTNDYIASLLCMIIPLICFFVLIISIIAEMIEPSKVPAKYYSFLLITSIIPLLSFGLYFMITKDLSWLN